MRNINSWVVRWHRSAPSQSLDQMLSERNAEIAIDAVGCIHGGKSSKLGSEVQCCIYSSSFHRSTACLPPWFGPCCPPSSGVLGGTGSPHRTTAVSEESWSWFIQQSRGSPRDWILAEFLTMWRSRASATFLKKEILDCPNNQVLLVNKLFHLNTAQELYTSCSPYLSLTLLRGLESKKQ